MNGNTQGVQCRRHFFVEFKIDAVQQVLYGKSVSEVCEKYNIHERNLYRWIEQHRAGRLKTASDNGRPKKRRHTKKTVTEQGTTVRKKYYTIEDVCQSMDVSRATVMKMIEDGMPAMRIGRTYRFLWKDVNDWVKKNCTVNTV